MRRLRAHHGYRQKRLRQHTARRQGLKSQHLKIASSHVRTVNAPTSQ